MPNYKEMSSTYKRMLTMLKEIEQEAPHPIAILERHIRSIEIEMDAEDVAYVEKKLDKK